MPIWEIRDQKRSAPVDKLKKNTNLGSIVWVLQHHVEFATPAMQWRFIDKTWWNSVLVNDKWRKDSEALKHHQKRYVVWRNIFACSSGWNPQIHHVLVRFVRWPRYKLVQTSCILLQWGTLEMPPPWPLAVCCCSFSHTSQTCKAVAMLGRWCWTIELDWLHTRGLWESDRCENACVKSLQNKSGLSMWTVDHTIIHTCPNNPAIRWDQKSLRSLGWREI